jgi:hypothetical protein
VLFDVIESHALVWIRVEDADYEGWGVANVNGSIVLFGEDTYKG